MQVDDNGDGVLQFEEFCRLIAQVCRRFVRGMSVGLCMSACLYVRSVRAVCMHVFALTPSASKGRPQAGL